MLRHITVATLLLSLFYFQAVRADFEVETLAQAVLQTYTEDYVKLVRKSNPKEQFQWNDRALKSSDFPNIVLRRYIGDRDRIPLGKNRYQVFQTDENGKIVAYPNNDLLLKILKENKIDFDPIAVLKNDGKPLAKHPSIYKFKGKYLEIASRFNPATKSNATEFKEIEYIAGLGQKTEEDLKKEYYFPTTLTNTALLNRIGLLQKGASFTSIEGKVKFPYNNGNSILEYTLEQSSMTPKRVIVDPDRLFYKYDPRAILKTITVKNISNRLHSENKAAKLDLTQSQLPTIGDNDILLGTPGHFEPFFPKDFRSRPLDYEKPELQIKQKIRQFPSEKTFYVLLSPKSDFLSPGLKDAIEANQDLSAFAYDDVHYYEPKKEFQNVRYEFEGVSKGYVVMRVDPL